MHRTWAGFFGVVLGGVGVRVDFVRSHMAILEDEDVNALSNMGWRSFRIPKKTYSTVPGMIVPGPLDQWPCQPEGWLEVYIMQFIHVWMYSRRSSIAPSFWKVTSASCYMFEFFFICSACCSSFVPSISIGSTHKKHSQQKKSKVQNCPHKVGPYQLQAGIK